MWRCQPAPVSQSSMGCSSTAERKTLDLHVPGSNPGVPTMAHDVTASINGFDPLRLGAEPSEPTISTDSDRLILEYPGKPSKNNKYLTIHRGVAETVSR